MVVGNRSNDRDKRVDHVGCVQSAAQPHFQHSHIHLLLAEVQKSQRSGELEGGGVIDDFRQRTEFIGEGNQVLLADPLPIDQDAFPEIDQVWRGVKPNFVTGGLQSRGNERGCRSFALRTGNMDGWEAFVRIAKQLHEFVHAVQLEKAVRVVHVPLHAEVYPAIDPIQTLLIFFLKRFHRLSNVNNDYKRSLSK